MTTMRQRLDDVDLTQPMEDILTEIASILRSLRGFGEEGLVDPRDLPTLLELRKWQLVNHVLRRWIEVDGEWRSCRITTS